MARTFVRASSQYLENVSTGLGAGTLSVFSLAVWYKPSSIANGTALGIGDTNTSNYIALGMNGSGNSFLEVSDNAGVTATAGTLTNGSWGHIAGVQSGATNRLVYTNGVAGTAETTSKTPTGLDTSTVGGLQLSGTRLSFAGGDIAYATVWSVALSGAEVASLAAGALPSSVQAASIVDNWRIDGTSSPEPDTGSANLPLTVVGATAAAGDPPVSGGGTPFIILPPPFLSGVSYAAQRAASI